jgi:hypothetical protein
VRTSDLYALAHAINTTPSLYLEAGAIHGTVLCEGDRPLVYMEDVGRHNAVDKIAGWMVMEGVSPAGKMLYTTGRLTSEMVIKTALMGMPALASRSGFTAWGVEIARQVGLTLIGRMRGRRFVCLSGAERIVYDADPAGVTDEPRHLRRKAAGATERPDEPHLTPRPKIAGVVLAGGRATRMGGGDKTLLDGRRPADPRARDRAAAPAGRCAGAERERRPGALRRVRARGGAGQRRGALPGRSPGSWPAWTGRRRGATTSSPRPRGTRRSFPRRWSRSCARRWSARARRSRWR